MSRRWILGFAALMTLCPLGVAQTLPTGAMAPSRSGVPQAGKLTLEEVLLLHHGAQGGLTRLKGLQVRRLEGRIENAGQEIAFTQVNARPDRCRIEFRIGDTTLIKACDGRTGWTQGPEGALGTLSPAEVTEMDADFDGPLIEPDLKGHQLVYLGIQTFEGRSVHGIEVRMRGGRVQRHLLDATTFLRLGVVNGLPGSEVTLFFSDYRTVEGVAMAHLIRVGTATLRLAKVSFPPNVREAVFRPPQ